jgi:hypothetical protein
MLVHTEFFTVHGDTDLSLLKQNYESKYPIVPKKK